MQKILLIKTGAAGDIVRTTVLLNALKGKITWVAESKYVDLLPDDHPLLDRVLSIEEAAEKLTQEKFDLTISLEEDRQCARLASIVPTQKIIGIFSKDDSITYTDDTSSWFDMSLVSRKGAHFANEAKWKNKDSFQQHLFRMIGQEFGDEPYCIYRDKRLAWESKLVGIETRSGNRWPNKAWGGYPELIGKLEAAGYTCRLLSERKNIGEYLDDIARCSFLISGDTLAMHVALAYKIPSIAIFNCTSPTEIHDYSLMRKVVSPLLQQSFYSQDYSAAVVNSISAETVYTIFRDHIRFTEQYQKV